MGVHEVKSPVVWFLKKTSEKHPLISWLQRNDLIDDCIKGQSPSWSPSERNVSNYKQYKQQSKEKADRRRLRTYKFNSQLSLRFVCAEKILNTKSLYLSLGEVILEEEKCWKDKFMGLIISLGSGTKQIYGFIKSSSPRLPQSESTNSQ